MHRYFASNFHLTRNVRHWRSAGAGLNALGETAAAVTKLVRLFQQNAINQPSFFFALLRGYYLLRLDRPGNFTIFTSWANAPNGVVIIYTIQYYY